MKLAEDLRRAVLQAAIEGKLTGVNREGWRFVRLGDVVNVVSARRVHQSDWQKSGIPFYRAREIARLSESGYVDNELYISEELFEKYSHSGMPSEGDIMITAVGTLGKTYIVKKGDKFYYKDASVLCLEKSDAVDSKYLDYVIKSELFMNQVRKNSSGTTVATLTIVRMNEYIIPLPPIDEQRRIVSRLDAIMPLIAELEAAENELEILERKFPCDMRDSLLQAAIQGKLTGSNTDNWRFVRLGDVVAKRIKRGKSPKYAPHSNTLVFAQKCNTKQGNIDLSLALYLDEATIGKYPEEEFMLDGDIVLNSTGRGTLGRVGQYRITDNPQNIPLVSDSHVTIIRPMKNISSEFICYVLKHYQPYIETLGEGTTNQTELSAKKVANLTIPLPPINEQHKIVARLNELLPLCEALEKIT